MTIQQLLLFGDAKKRSSVKLLYDFDQRNPFAAKERIGDRGSVSKFNINPQSRAVAERKHNSCRRK